jgi:hypothetical protein
MNHLIALPAAPAVVISDLASAAQTRFWEFFVSNIRNPHTRRAYGRCVQEFLAWCEQYRVRLIADVQSLNVGTYRNLWGEPNVAVLSVAVGFFWRRCRCATAENLLGSFAPAETKGRTQAGRRISKLPNGIGYQGKVFAPVRIQYRTLMHSQLQSVYCACY